MHLNNYISVSIEGYNEIPRIIHAIDTDVSYPITKYDDSKEYTYENGQSTVPFEINSNNITLLHLGKDAFKVESRYLGSNLLSAINALNLRKSNLQDPKNKLNIQGSFYQINETAWSAFNRLIKMVPEGCLVICGIEKLYLVDSSPSVVHTFEGNRVTRCANYSESVKKYPARYGSNNPSYCKNTIPITPLAYKNINKVLGDTKLIYNYIDHSSKYYQESIINITTSKGMDIGDGVDIDGSIYTIISRSSTLSNSGVIEAIYTCALL